jgi:hypothetical protein
VTRHALPLKDLKLPALADSCMHEIVLPLHVRPESFAGLCLRIRLEFRLHPFARARFDLVRRSRRGVSPHPLQDPRHIVGKLRDVSDWAKTDLHLDMPADNGRVCLVPDCKEVDLCEPMLDAPNREKLITTRLISCSRR